MCTLFNKLITLCYTCFFAYNNVCYWPSRGVCQYNNLIFLFLQISSTDWSNYWSLTFFWSTSTLNDTYDVNMTKRFKSNQCIWNELAFRTMTLWIKLSMHSEQLTRTGTGEHKLDTNFPKKIDKIQHSQFSYASS